MVFAFSSFAQVTTTDTTNNKFKLDDELLNLLDSIKKPKSYVDFSVGVGNKLFSVKNNAVNSSQSQVNKLFYTGALSYHNKSGFSVAVMPYLSTENNQLKIYQTAVTPGFYVENKKVDFSFSYTRYLSDYKSYNSNATYQNDFYTNVQYKKTFLQPTLSLGYSTGNFKEINIDTIKVLNNRIVRDSTKNSIKNFSASVGVEHSFEFEKVFTSKDGISIIPQLLLVAGTEKLAITHTNKNFSSFVNKSKRFKSRTKNENTAFSLQSLALSFDVNYSVGNFYVTPNLYIDYFLPATTGKRVSSFYSLTAGISF